MLEQKITVANQLGLHARASAKIVACASTFVSTILISKNNREANAKSIMSLMMLSASKGSEITIKCDGIDEVQAMQSICELITNKFGEGQ